MSSHKKVPMFERVFSQDDLTAFARVSGDFNPIHTDPVQARRSVFNSTVAHGISTLFWALDCAILSRDEAIRIQSIRAKFAKPVRVGEPIQCDVKEQNDKEGLIHIINHDEIAAKIEVAWARPRSKQKVGFSLQDPKRVECRMNAGGDIEEACGKVPLHLNAGSLASLFPVLSARLEPVQISQLLATTRVVGMECPGLHSIYRGMDLVFANREGSYGDLEYKVTRFDERIRRVDIAVSSENLQGTLTTFLRPPPLEQADVQTLQEGLIRGEFESQKALVIGGSRGIGEVAAKLLAGGGADVHLTFNQGRDDADRIVREIVHHGGKASSSFLNVLEPAHFSSEDVVTSGPPTHLYYFATPPISVGTHKSFSASVFTRFCDFYVGGLVKVVSRVAARDLRGLFFPSSIFVEELPLNMGEYSAAKMAGEGVCRLLEKWYPDVMFAVPRLPRMRTDQTVSLLGEALPAPEEVILDPLRSFHAATKSPGNV